MQIVILLFMINRWTMKLWINKFSTIQIPSLNYNNTYTEDSKYWNILFLLFSLFNQNQSFKDNSNSIKPNTYIHMSVKNSKNKNNNLQKPLPNAVTIFFSSNYLPKYLSYMLTLNLIRKLYISMNNSHWLGIKVKA